MINQEKVNELIKYILKTEQLAHRENPKYDEAIRRKNIKKIEKKLDEIAEKILKE